ncbi:hypothetical protein GTA07_17230 [Rhodococcus hoagii]|nr:hypothetical protein [Prescottella equi]
MEKLETKIQRVLKSPVGDSHQSRVYNQDAAGIWPEEVSQLDAIITSPPFSTALDFILPIGCGLVFGWDALDFSTKPAHFVEVKQRIDFSVYEPIFRQSAARLKDGGYFALHLGKKLKMRYGKKNNGNRRKASSTSRLF